MPCNSTKFRNYYTAVFSCAFLNNIFGNFSVLLLENLKGEIDQIPPIFSAKLIDGQRAYDIARAGKDAEMKPARIKIHELEVISFNKPLLKIAISCSKGTYIRSFARDIGVAAGSGAHLTALVRSASGPFRIENALNMDEAERIFEIL